MYIPLTTFCESRMCGLREPIKTLLRSLLATHGPLFSPHILDSQKVGKGIFVFLISKDHFETYPLFCPYLRSFQNFLMVFLLKSNINKLLNFHSILAKKLAFIPFLSFSQKNSENLGKWIKIANHKSLLESFLTEYETSNVYIFVCIFEFSPQINSYST